MIAPGVRAGATIPNQDANVYPGRPDSAMVGSSGSEGKRWGDYRQCADPSASDLRQRRRDGIEHGLTWPATTSANPGAVPL